MTTSYTYIQPVIPHTARYHTALAIGVLAYAHHDPVVASYLRARAPAATVALPTMSVPHPILLPQTREQALRRTQWLIHYAPHQTPVRDILAHATRINEEPKAIVLGIDMGALPLGVWGKWKRKDHAMHILIPTGTPIEDSAMQHALLTATHRVVEHGLIAAHGSTKCLEPELGEWLFGDKAIAVYTAPESTFADIRAFLDALSAPYAHTLSSRDCTLLALSPSLYLGDLPHHNHMEAYTTSSTTSCGG